MNAPMPPDPAPRGLTARSLRGAAWSGGTSMLRLVVKFASIAILARLLTPEDYGIVAGATIAVEFAAMLYGLGLAQTLSQRRALGPDHIATALGTTIALAIAAAAALWALAPILAELLRIEALTPVVRVLAVIAPFGAFNTICESLLARAGRVRQIGLRALAASLVSVFAVAVPLAWFGWGHWALIAMMICEVILGAALNAVVARDLLVRPGFSIAAFRDMARVSVGFSLNKPVGYLSKNVSRLLVARLMGAEMLGLFSRASAVNDNVVNLFNTIVRTVALPVMSQVQDDPKRMRRSLRKALALTALATFPASAFAVVFAPEIVAVLLGSGWGAATAPFALICAGLYFRMGQRVCSTVLNALGRTYVTIVPHVVATAIIAAGIPPLADRGLGAVGAVILIAMAASYTTMAWTACRAVGLGLAGLARLHTLPALLAAGTVLAGVAAKAALSGFPAAPTLLVAAAGMALASAAALHALPAATAERWDMTVPRDLLRGGLARLRRGRR